MTNHNTSGTSAIEVTRNAHQCSTPSFAEPRPIARPSGERIGARKRWSAISIAPAGQADEPGGDCQHGGRGQNRPAAGIDALQFEAAAGVPPQMPDAVAEMVEQRHAPAEQQDQAEPGTEKTLHPGISLG